MQYLLTKEEYDEMIPKNEHIKIRNSLLDTIEKANDKILEMTHFKCDKSKCSMCPIGLYGSNTCISIDKF